MQNEQDSHTVRSDLLERLRALEGPQSSGSLAELAYRRAREALEHALEEARNVRLQAIEDARATRERELHALMESMKTLRQSAERQIEELIATAEIEAQRIREEAESEARNMAEQARAEAADIRVEAVAIRSAAEERSREVERIETDFNNLLARIAERFGLTEKPSEGWWKRVTGGH